MRSSSNSRFTYTLALGFLAAAPVSTSTCDDRCDPIITDLVADGVNVGAVTVWSDETTINVTYELTDPTWTLNATHLYVGRNPPTSAAGGQYPYAHHVLLDSTDSYSIPLVSLGVSPKAPLYVAATATLGQMGGFSDRTLRALERALPDDPSPAFIAPSGGLTGTFTATFGEGSALEGTWSAYSADVHQAVFSNLPQLTRVISSYDDDFASNELVAHPNNVDHLNWALNQYAVGQLAQDGRRLSPGDLQMAWWMLLEGEPGQAKVGHWSQAHVDEIVNAAMLEGMGFRPGCFDAVAVFLDPQGGRGPITLIALTAEDLSIPCLPDVEATVAWAEGDHALGIEGGGYLDWTCR